MNNKKILMLLLAVLSFSGCAKIKEIRDEIRGKIKPGSVVKEQGASQKAVFAVNTTVAVKGQIQDYIALSGDIVAGSTVDVYSDAAGKVARVFTAVGQRVNKGARIAAVDPSKPGMIYQWGVALAPISGTVVALPAQVGMTVSQAVPLARISGGSALEIRLYVAERFISKMAMNLPCEITLDAWPGDIFQGSISEIAPTVDPASRTMEVRINVNNADSKLKEGMFAKVKIITEHKSNIVKIPATAMLNRFGEQYVFVIGADPDNIEQKIVKKRTIVPGIIIDGILEIQDGLVADEEIVVRGQTLLEDGAWVNIIEKFAPLSAN